MAAAEHQKITIYGTLAQGTGSTGNEEFSFSVAVLTSLTDEEVAVIGDNAAYGNWDQSGIGISVGATYTGCRVETINTAGKVISSYNKPNANNRNGENSQLEMTICCQAITLETASVDSKGRKVRGRIYPPAMAVGPLGSTLPVSATADYVTAWAAFFTYLETQGCPPQVASSTSAGLTPVTGISADNIVDTQRRRKNQLTGTRSAIVAI